MRRRRRCIPDWPSYVRSHTRSARTSIRTSLRRDGRSWFRALPKALLATALIRPRALLPRRRKKWARNLVRSRGRRAIRSLRRSHESDEHRDDRYPRRGGVVPGARERLAAGAAIAGYGERPLLA